MLQGAAVGGATGLASSLPRKRSKDPEIIKAKELARNRYNLDPAIHLNTISPTLCLNNVHLDFDPCIYDSVSTASVSSHRR